MSSMHTRPVRVLVVPGATEIAMEVRAALGHRPDIELYSAGIAEGTHADLVFARHEPLPMVDDPEWAERLGGIIRDHDIDLVYPAHDSVVLACAEAAATLGAAVVGSPADTCRVARSKRLTYAVLGVHVPVPRVVDEAVLTPADFPLFIKPDVGQGSQGAVRVDGPEALATARAAGADLLMEYLPGEEFTVDCFTDRHGRLAYAGPRQRDRTRAGISMASHHVEDPDLSDMAERINRVLTLRGAWFFQTRRDTDGTHHLLEVAPRIAGTSAVARAAGVNLPLLSVYTALGIDVEVTPTPGEVSVDRALVNRYRHAYRYGAVYVDLDDTLLIRGRVNAELVGFLFECLNHGREVVLVTRHRGDVEQTLQRHRLTAIFDRIEHLGDHAPKSAVINRSDAIFIDDSFAERREVATTLGIPVFDSDQVEVLSDARV